MKNWFKFITVFALTVMVIATVTPTYASAYSKTTTPSTVTKIKAPAPIKGPSPGKEAEPQIWVSIGKKAVVLAVRHGGFALSNLIKKIPYRWAQSSSKSIAKYGNKAANVIEEINNFTETGVTLGLVKAGIPPSDARNIAKFVCFFL
ncbi:hypothetical protein ACSVDE_14900 [Pseudalkalibacillus sp. Hm43]|uniref:hypothetical protein n=1 Tax=Pseudalkalibacillus sp. Hm43 TaxID=3450742 RepID=UPI003F43F614